MKFASRLKRLRLGDGIRRPDEMIAARRWNSPT